MKFVAKINVWLTFSPPLFCWGLWIRESGSGMGKKSGFGFQDRWRIRNTVFFFHLLYLYHSENKFVVIPCFGIHKFHKIEYYLIFEMLKKIFAPIFKNYRTFNPKNVTCQHCGGSGMFIPDPGSWFLPILDPGSGSATLLVEINLFIFVVNFIAIDFSGWMTNRFVKSTRRVTSSLQRASCLKISTKRVPTPSSVGMSFASTRHCIRTGNLI